jgi:hypothetical protein
MFLSKVIFRSRVSTHTLRLAELIFMKCCSLR